MMMMSLVLTVVVLEAMNSGFLVSWSGCATALVSSDDVCVCVTGWESVLKGHFLN